MKFFIDTANLDQIKEAQALGVLDGVTTNPSLMAKEGIKGEKNIIKCAEVGADVATCPLSAILGLLKHPLTDNGLAQFLADHKKVNG